LLPSNIQMSMHDIVYLCLQLTGDLISCHIMSEPNSRTVQSVSQNLSAGLITNKACSGICKKCTSICISSMCDREQAYASAASSKVLVGAWVNTKFAELKAVMHASCFFTLNSGCLMGARPGLIDAHANPCCSFSMHHIQWGVSCWLSLVWGDHAVQLMYRQDCSFHSLWLAWTVSLWCWQCSEHWKAFWWLAHASSKLMYS
jgi:hypothetical protein